MRLAYAPAFCVLADALEEAGPEECANQTRIVVATLIRSLPAEERAVTMDYLHWRMRAWMN
jgi:hypothetical protein